MTWEELVLKEKEKTYFRELLTFVEKEYQEQMQKAKARQEAAKERIEKAKSKKK